MMRRDAGLTMIELVVAMAVFALVAVMGLQSLTGLLRNRDQLVARADQTSDLGQGLAMIRNDLSAVVPMLFFPPDRAAPRSAILVQSNGFAMSLGGQAGFPGTGWHRSIWRHDAKTGKLSRRIWPALTPLQDRALAPEVEIMRGVTSLQYRSYWTGFGWVDGWSNPTGRPLGASPDSDRAGPAPEIYSDSLPRAISLIIETVEYGPIPLIEALQ